MQSPIITPTLLKMGTKHVITKLLELFISPSQVASKGSRANPLEEQVF